MQEGCEIKETYPLASTVMYPWHTVYVPECKLLVHEGRMESKAKQSTAGGEAEHSIREMVAVGIMNLKPVDGDTH